MIKIEERTKCCGCTACYNICPQKAIDMVPDFEGFAYPSVNLNKCINCGLCNKVCPIENKIDLVEDVKSAYVLRSKDTYTLMKSTSGGFVTPMIDYVLRNNGVVCAASYNDKFEVHHVIIEERNLDSIEKLRGSKYVQSFLGSTFSRLKDYLKKNRLVMFIGTTCQVNGLKSFLQKNYDNLITVDLVCHGTPSPKLWEKYLAYQREKYHSEIEEIVFRNKTYGYHSGTMKIRFSNGKTYYGSARVDYMLKSFFKEICSRPVCYECPFKTEKRCSDFTIYDCWHASSLVADLKDDDGGYTNVMVRTTKGKNILKAVGDFYELFSIDYKRAIELDGSMVLHSAVSHPRRNEFYQALDEDTLNYHIQKFIPITQKDMIIERVKVFMYKFGLYAFARKIIKKWKL